MISFLCFQIKNKYKYKQIFFFTLVDDHTYSVLDITDLNNYDTRREIDAIYFHVNFGNMVNLLCFGRKIIDFDGLTWFLGSVWLLHGNSLQKLVNTGYDTMCISTWVCSFFLGFPDFNPEIGDFFRKILSTSPSEIFLNTPNIRKQVLRLGPKKSEETDFILCHVGSPLLLGSSRLKLTTVESFNQLAAY